MNELMIQSDVLGKSEEKSLELCSLYKSFGYSLFRMSKFEEYSLYSKYRDFLTNDKILSFTDTNGRLMALKPDITLSLARNGSVNPDRISRYFYKENVYRSIKNGCFKEITQVGLECLGPVDCVCVGEALYLASLSLESISDNYVLLVSSLDILFGYLSNLDLDESSYAAVLKCFKEKNYHGIEEICRARNIENALYSFKELLSFCGGFEILPRIEIFCEEHGLEHEFAQLQRALSVFAFATVSHRIQIDFSLTENSNFYNGIVFSGYIKGVPDSVLYGGQYDKLLGAMGINAGSVGFAVYMEKISQVLSENSENSENYVDTVLLYDKTTPSGEVIRIADSLRKDGSVLTLKKIPEDLKYGKICILKEGKVTVNE